MTEPDPAPTQSVIRPSVVAAIVYFGLCAIWFLWILLNVRFRQIGDPEPLRFITLPQYAGVTAINVAFLAAFVFDGLAARRSPPDLRRAHFAGLGMALVVLVLVQLCLFYAYDPLQSG